MNKIKCKYIFSKDYNPKYINGASGGINIQGEIVANFYLERNALPNSQTFEITEGKISGVTGSEPEDLEKSFVRVIENGIVMNYKTAKEIYNWLGQHIKRLENIENSAESK